MSRGVAIAMDAFSVSATPGWVFHQFTNLVLARRDSRGGSLQLSTAFRFSCRDNRAPGHCERCAREWLAATHLGVFTAESLGNDEWLGTARVGADGTGGRAWYLLRDGQLVLGVYQCSPGIEGSSLCEEEMGEVDGMIRSLTWAKAAQQAAAADERRARQRRRR